MTELLLRVPWFVTGAAVVAFAAAVAVLGNTYAGVYFEQTCENEVDLLTGNLDNGCGQSDGEKATVPHIPTPGAEAPGTTRPTATATIASPATGATLEASPTAIIPATPVRSTPGIIASGAFRDGEPGHRGSGTAAIQHLADGSLNLRLADFSVTNGPDLIVYLSPSPDSYVSGGVNLGELRANNGNQNYAIPAGTDIAEYRSVVIWCRSFPTVFAYATLEVQ